MRGWSNGGTAVQEGIKTTKQPIQMWGGFVWVGGAVQGAAVQAKTAAFALKLCCWLSKWHLENLSVYEIGR